jgi:hypothetical protein
MKLTHSIGFQPGPALAGTKNGAARQHRHLSVMVRAADGFCRDKVSLNTGSAVAVEGTATLVFLGANGQQVEVQGAKVRPTGSTNIAAIMTSG